MYFVRFVVTELFLYGCRYLLRSFVIYVFSLCCLYFVLAFFVLFSSFVLYFLW